MRIFTKPQNLNGTELMQELAQAGLIVQSIEDFANGTIGFETNDEALATSIVSAHNGTTVAPELCVADKLASVGLSVADLKTGLGL